MSSSSLEKSVKKSLLNLNREKSLKDLFWSQLNYDRVNKELSCRNWNNAIASELVSDPLLLASGGKNNDFRVIYSRLKGDRISKQKEREVVNQLLADNPYSLFVFSNESRTQWHFLNVKYDDSPERRKLFRRIKVEAGDNQLRTAIEQLSLLDLESFNSDSPLEIQKQHDEAFDVEVVTQKFFTQYRQVFERVEGLIQGIDISEQKRLYTQKLFNRLMFIGFIQKKGWLTYNGDKDYLSALWKAYKSPQPRLSKSAKSSNFYRDRLSHLFFSGLNNSSGVNIIDINNGGFLQNLIGTVPFLNGGLFERDEEDKDSKIVVPDECIDLILHDLFQKFAFTVTESTPLDVEVAVDPEMLGKVFEELVTGRHESGSYYTPKPIVSFMCRESLKGYLNNLTPSPSPTKRGEEEKRKAIALLVDEQNPEKIDNPEAVLEAIKKVKTCDLACGSGAYLLGMLHELLDLRQRLESSILPAFDNGARGDSVYQHKLEIIQNNLYGVDIDVFAVNIARLRLWLSLAVDYEGDKPKPLPNLKYKIEVGDSLITPNPTEIKLTDVLIEKYRQVKAEYIKTHNGDRKKDLEKEITKLKKEISLITYGNDKVNKFDWSLDFAEVFANGGFDVIVANPPYVRMELFKDIKPTLKKNFPEVHSDRADLYCYFYGRAFQLLKKNGMLTFISSNKWLKAKYGVKLRKHIADNYQTHNIIDFGDLPVFKSATAYPMIFIAKNAVSDNISPTFVKVKSLNSPYPNIKQILQEEGKKLASNSFEGSKWNLSSFHNHNNTFVYNKSNFIELGEYAKNKIFYGIKTGLTKAFVINGHQKAEIIKYNPECIDIIKPLIVGKDVCRWKANYKDKWLLYMHHGVDVSNLPAVIEHLQSYRQKLENRATKQKWYELQQPQLRYTPAFEKPKIVYQRFQVKPCFAYDESGTYMNDAVWTIALDDFYLLGVLNSQSFWLEISKYCTPIRNGYQLLRNYLEKTVIPNASNSEKETISKLVQKCLDAKGVDCEAWEKEIDDRVAALYGL